MATGGLASDRRAAYFARRIGLPGSDHGQISKVGIVFLLGIFAILSLIVAAGGHNNFQYWGGLGFFVGLILLIFYAVHQLTEPNAKHSTHP